MTLLQALTVAGGVTERGSQKRAKVLRTVNGKKQEVKIQLADLVQPEDTIVVPGSRIVRQDFEANSQVVTVGDDTPDFEERQTAWTSDADTTSSRTRGRASSTRVIRACEISLTLDGDCTGK